MEKQNGLSRDTGRAFLWIETGRIKGEKGTFRCIGKYILQFRKDYIVVLESIYCSSWNIILWRWKVNIAVSGRLYYNVVKYVSQFQEYYIIALKGLYSSFGKFIS